MKAQNLASLKDFDSILLNFRDLGWRSSRETVQTLLDELTKKPDFQQTYQQDDVYIFQRRLNRKN